MGICLESGATNSGQCPCVRFLGDTVIPLYIPQCGECKFCLNPKTNLCQKIRLVSFYFILKTRGNINHDK